MAADPETINEEILNAINEITGAIIGAAMKVSTALGAGFAEKVYENLLVSKLRKAGLEVRQQAPIRVEFEGEVLGTYVADLLVESVVIVEVKAIAALQAVHRMQCVNYLRATGLPICLLLNFGRRRLEYKRFANTGTSRPPATLQPSR